jgi:PAS domain-containing protein
MLGVVQDITQQVRTREVLRAQTGTIRESEERYRAFIQHSSEAIWRLEFSPIDIPLPVKAQVAAAYHNGRFAECIAVMARMYGLTSSDEATFTPRVADRRPSRVNAYFQSAPSSRQPLRCSAGR